MGQENSKNTTQQDGSPNARESRATNTGESSSQGMEEAIVHQVVNKVDPATVIFDGIRFGGKKIGSTIDYVKSLHEKYDRLEDEVKKLYKRRDDVADRTKSDEFKRASIDCEAWMDEVHNVEQEVCYLTCKYVDELEHHKLKHFVERSNLSEMITKMCDEVHSCWEKGGVFLTEALVDKPPASVIKIKNPPNIENLQSLQGVIRSILGYFPRHKRIGLCGNVGVGKTAILENLNNDKDVAELFELVIFATLAYEGDEEKSQCVNEKLERAKKRLQLQIAQRLKLNIEDIANDTKEIASRISAKLRSTRYLLILDEVWHTFSLNDIGIEENEEDSKVVLASRHYNICLGMDVGETIKVKPLSPTQALKLFFEKLDRKMNQPDIDPIAGLVVEECGYLPMLIDRVARTFKMIERTAEQQQQRKKLWENALERLRQFGMDPSVQFDGMDEFLIRLRYCYEELNDDNRKKCFLYGALYPNGYEIYENHLLECWDAENLTVPDYGISILQSLISVSFLVHGEKVKHIRMHKVLRSFALSILSESKDTRYLVRAGDNLVQPPAGEEEWNGVKWISMMDSNLSSLPGNPGCNSLSTLLLQGNDCLTMIPDSFFRSMQNLHVLNLHGTGITMLPESISCLKELRVLHLNSCNQLEKLPTTISELSDKLEVLDIRDTRINCLPIEIKDLHQLRCLRMSLSNIGGEARNVNIDQQVISKLFLLEELLIVVDAQNEWWKELLISVSDKLATMRRSNMKRRRFQISFGEDQSISVIDYFRNKINRCLKYENAEGASRAISEFAGANEFELIGHGGRFKLSDFGIDHISKIESCVIQSCLEMETIIHATDEAIVVLECLEKMYIRDLPKLVSMWEGVVPNRSLGQLTTLIFFKCSNLKKVFSRDLIQQLTQLQELTIQDCDEIEEIVMEYSENNWSEPGGLPSLRELKLHNLPKLRCKWTANLLRFRSLELDERSGCPLLEQLLYGSTSNFRN